MEMLEWGCSWELSMDLLLSLVRALQLHSPPGFPEFPPKTGWKMALNGIWEGAALGELLALTL